MPDQTPAERAAENVLYRASFVRTANQKRDILVIIQQAIDEATEEMRRELLLLAKLSADTPQFYNPLEALAAKTIRDRILRSNPCPR